MILLELLQVPVAEVEQVVFVPVAFAGGVTAVKLEHKFEQPGVAEHVLLLLTQVPLLQVYEQPPYGANG